MADFSKIFDKGLLQEGGYQLTNAADDKGGVTFAGISRKSHPDWPGWTIIDAGKQPEAQLVKDFYKETFWDKMAGDAISNQKIAESIYSFYINAGKPALTIAQIIVQTTPDGVYGPQTIAALNEYTEDLFLAHYALGKIARYVAICRHDPSQKKWLLGWTVRTLQEA